MVKHLSALWRPGLDPWVGKILWRRAWQPTPVFSPGEFHGQRSLEGCSPWGRTEVDTTEATEHTHTYLCREHSIGDDCGQEWAAQSGFGDEQEASSARAEAG